MKLVKQDRTKRLGARRDHAGHRGQPRLAKPVRPAGAGKGTKVASNAARQRYQKYVALAEAAEKSGDRVASESYYQHADHYYRLWHGDGVHA